MCPGGPGAEARGRSGAATTWLRAGGPWSSGLRLHVRKGNLTLPRTAQLQTIILEFLFSSQREDS